MTRQTGVTCYVMPESVSGPFDNYALVVRSDGQTRMVHSEGVAYEVSEEKPWKWNDYSDTCPEFSQADLLTLAFSSPQVDLSEWVRTFGARLESNFGLIHSWATAPERFHSSNSFGR